MKTGSSRRVLGLLALAAACTEPVPPIPDPDTTGMETAVQERIAAARSAIAEAPRSDQAWGRLGMVLHVHELHEPATAAYRQARRLDPDEIRWPYFLGDVLSAQGTDLDGAIEAFRAAIAIRPDYAPARLRLADALLLSGKPEAAVEAYGRALDLVPDLGPARLGRGQAQLQLDRLTAAVADLERAAELLPNSPTALYALSRAHLRLGRREEAEAVAARARRADGVDFYDDPLMREVRSEAASSNLLWERARALLSTDDTRAAIPLLKRVAQMRSDEPRIHHQLGAAYQAIGRGEPAIRELTRAVELDPELHDARVQLALALLDAGRPAEALPHLTAASRGRPDDSTIHALTGRAHLLREDLDAALEAFEEAGGAGSLPAWAHNSWGTVLAQRGRFTEAIEHFRMALAEQPSNPEILFHLGLALEGAGREREAVAHYRRALAIEPNPLAAARLSVLTRQSRR